MIECNIPVIPKIITVTDISKADELGFLFAHDNGIEASHVLVVAPEKEELTVDQIHLFQKDIQYIYSKKLLVVLVGVDASSAEVQNSLLKSLEEESDRIQFLLLVKNKHLLLPTIISRCATEEHAVFSPHFQKEEISLPPFSFQRNSESTKEMAVERIDSYIQSSSMSSVSILAHLLRMRKLIIDNNVNPILALDEILIFLSKASTMKVINGK